MQITRPDFAILVLLAIFFSNVHAASKPNVVLIFMDNFGWGELGSYGEGVLRGVPPPNLDQLANEGKTGNGAPANEYPVPLLIDLHQDSKEANPMARRFAKAAPFSICARVVFIMLSSRRRQLTWVITEVVVEAKSLCY